MKNKKPVHDISLPELESALEKLIHQFHDHPGVTLIDIGLESIDQQNKQQIALRIHLQKQQPDNDDKIFPAQVNGIPVRLVYVDYELGGQIN